MQQPNFNTNKDVSELLPVACHFDAETLITKSSDLIQVIKVTGFSSNKEIKDLRAEIKGRLRNFIQEKVDTRDLSVYIHIIREKQNLTDESIPSSDEELQGLDTVKHIDYLWRKKNNWDQQYLNTLYISICRKVSRSSLIDVANSLKSLVFPLYRKSIQSKIDGACVHLHNFTQALTKTLEDFGASRLSVKKLGEKFISEPLSFINKLTHLSDEVVELAEEPSDLKLSQLELDYSFNQMHFSDKNGNKHAAVFTVKDICDLPNRTLDQVLHLGQSLIITEILIFDHKENVTKEYKDYSRMLGFTNGTELLEYKGVDKILNSPDKIGAFCMQQISLVTYADTEQKLQDNLEELTNTTKNIGLPIIREDFFMAKVFWSQIPGNLKFVARTIKSSTCQSLNFSSIHDNLLLRRYITCWDKPVTMLSTINDNPMFFNFHNKENNGATLIMGAKGYGKSTLINLLVSQSLKQDIKVIWLNTKEQTSSLISKLGGKVIDGSKGNYNIGLFSSNNVSKQGKAKIITSLITKSLKVNDKVNNEVLKFLDNLDSSNSIEEALEKTTTGTTKNMLTSLLESDGYKALLSKQLIEVPEESLLEINLTNLKAEPLMKEVYCLLAMSYFMQNLNTPTLIVAEDCNNIFYHSELYNLCQIAIKDRRSEKVVGIISSLYPNFDTGANQDMKLTDNFGTSIFISDKFIDKRNRKILGLTEEEFHSIRNHDKERRTCLVKQDDISAVVSFKFNELTEYIS